MRDQGNRTRAQHRERATPLVFIQGKSLLVEGNIIEAAGKPILRRALGGLQLGGASADVIIRNNKIAGGNGDGILLGSMHIVEIDIASDTDKRRQYLDRKGHAIYVWQASNTPLGCVDWWPTPRPKGKPNQVPVSDGPIWRLKIVDNLIEDMGGNGISCIPLDLAVTNQQKVVGSPLGEVNDVLILGNDIRHCVTLPIETIPEGLEDTLARGGIVLARTENASLVGNTIENCATDHDGAVCGIFVAAGIGLAIEDNTIRHNGEPQVRANIRRNGLRGGIYLLLAVQRLENTLALRLDMTAPAAALIHRNRVSTVAARALTVVAIGPVQIHDNDFGVKGIDAGTTGLARGGLPAQAIARQLVTPKPLQEASANTIAPGPASQEKLQQAFITASLGDQTTLPALPLLLDSYGAASILAIGLARSFTVDKDEHVVADSKDGQPASSWIRAFGNVSFNDNIVSLVASTQLQQSALLAKYGAASGTDSQPADSTGMNVALISMDDAVSDSNRIAIAGYAAVTANLFAQAMTVRATANRLQEPQRPKSVFLSALTAGEFANATALNQADNCIADIITDSAFDAVGRPHGTDGAGKQLTLNLNVQHVAALNGDDICAGARRTGMEIAAGINRLTAITEAVGIVYANYHLKSAPLHLTLTALAKSPGSNSGDGT